MDTSGSQKPISYPKGFTPPRKVSVLKEKFPNSDRIEIEDSGSCSTTEDMQEDEMDSVTEELIRDEAQNWLAIHGPKLFALESSKFLVAEAKRKTVRGNR